jgi:DNA helicase-4
MCFFKKNKEKTKENKKPSKKELNEELNRQCGEVCVQIDEAILAANAYFQHKDRFVDVSAKDLWVQKYTLLNQTLTPQYISSFQRSSRYKELYAKYQTFQIIPGTLKDRITNHNNAVAQNSLYHAYQVVRKVEGRMLDQQQMISIMKPARNHLIIAGAGTGKTTTVVGKIKYLLKTGAYKPEDILVLSFTNASATEMSERIHKETEAEIEASTFHKLGLNIINAVEGKKPKIHTESLSLFIKARMQELMRIPDYMNDLCRYAVYYRSPIREQSEFASREEYREYLKSNAPRTLQGEDVKSYGEMDIANFLYQNGISYKYEASYQFDTNTKEYGQYHPDFYLPDYNIYIEYFGINRAGDVADYFKGDGELSASETYRKGMEWKRQLHAANQTSMIECYAYEKFEGTLLTELERKLKDKGVSFHPLSSEQIWQKVSEENAGILEGIIELFNTVINLTKSNNYTIEKLEELAANSPNRLYDSQVVALLKPIFAAYNDMLSANGEIDFNDMINVAAEYVRTGKYVNPYKYVIVDEYQDISKARFQLLYALRQSSYYDLFCVGDDWQSIYRFAGSDTNYIVDFERYWGTSEIDRIETTYRFSRSLIDISSKFIMRNPRQLEKNIHGVTNDYSFALGVIGGYTDKNAIQFMVEKLTDLPENATVYFIGRYSFDVDLLKANELLNVQYDNASQDVRVVYNRRRDLKMKFITAHKSKGLQADYVFIINNKNTKMGFPSKIMDASILDLLLEAKEAYPHAEERRLYYVALTRAKKKVYLLTLQGKESEFAAELIYRYKEELDREKYTCPKCGGRLVMRTAKQGVNAGNRFYGCSNYPECRYTRNVKNENLR